MSQCDENDENTLHVVLPGVTFDKIPRKGANKAKVPLAVYEEAKNRGIDIRDVDLRSGSGGEVAILKDDFTDDGANFADPTARDTKGDGRTTGNVWDYFVNADNDPTTRDGNDAADGTDRATDTGKD